MRPNTVVFVKLESKGRPQDTLVLEAMPIRAALIEMLGWFGRTQMGHCIKVTVARSAADLARYSGAVTSGADIESIKAELDELIDWDALDSNGGED